MYRESELQAVDQTAHEMYRLATAWCEDMAEYASLSLPEVFDLLKNIPYRADPDGMEYLQRPFYTLTASGRGGDCDDKAICVGAWATLNQIPFRFVAVSESRDRDLHHVYTELYIGNSWVAFDPTYAYNVLGRPMGDFPVKMILSP